VLLPEDRNLRNRLIVAIKRRIASVFDTSKWYELAHLAYEGEKVVLEHGRLLRSLGFGDDDYEANIIEVVKTLLDCNPGNLDIILDYIDFQDWLKQDSPKDYAAFYGYTNTLLQQAASTAVRTSADVESYISRIQSSIDKDPALAVGSIKELVESVLKTILTINNEVVGKEDFTDLLKRVQKLLDLDPQNVSPNTKGAEIVKRTLSNLGQVIKGIDELRNLYGTGHGQVQASSISPRHARLVVGAGASLAVFLMETHEHRIHTGKITPSKLP
jgi:hypothetical protein